MPRIYGLMIAKNEADIIEQSLAHALGHCDKIIVMDNMSTDGTWELAEAVARRFPGRVVAHCRLEQKFHDRLRAIAYNAFRHELTAKDWWLRLDADEFMNSNPAATLDLANREGADFVRANQMEFALTDLDIAAIERGEDNRSRPIEQRRRYYRVKWREFRFFRNDPATVWNTKENAQFPQNLSKERICSEAVFNRHYAHRDIDQIKARIAVRAGSLSFTHVAEKDWRKYTCKASGQHIWSPGSDVKFAPITDFWIPRIKLELSQRLGLMAKPA